MTKREPSVKPIDGRHSGNRSKDPARFRPCHGSEISWFVTRQPIGGPPSCCGRNSANHCDQRRRTDAWVARCNCEEAKTRSTSSSVPRTGRPVHLFRSVRDRPISRNRGSPIRGFGETQDPRWHSGSQDRIHRSRYEFALTHRESTGLRKSTWLAVRHLARLSPSLVPAMQSRVLRFAQNRQAWRTVAHGGLLVLGHTRRHGSP